MPDSGDHTELLGHHLRPELLDVATGRLHPRPRSMIENLALRLRSTRYAVLAYPHAESRQRTHRKVTRRNSANQRSEQAVHAKRQKDTGRIGGSRTSPSKIAGNPR